MKRLHSYLLRAALLCILPFSTPAQSIELQAITDFINLDSGEVPYYVDDAGDRNALAINAADPELRDKFARAEHVFTGTDGLYDITINALGEIDGDGTYRLLVNGVVQGELVNTPVTVDYTVIEHLFQAIALSNQDVIGVESKAVSNDMIPEGDGFAFARGRWRSVTIDAHTPEVVFVDASADLGVSLATTTAPIMPGQPALFMVNIANNATTNTATAPMVILSLPDGFEFISSDICIATSAGAQCELANLAPAQTTSASFTGQINVADSIEIIASVGANQADNNLANNTATLTVEAVDQTEMMVEVDMLPDVDTDMEPTTDNTATDIDPMSTSTNTSDEMKSDSGATGIAGLLTLMLLGVLRFIRRKINVAF